MKKLITVISTLALLTACTKKSNDFVGVYNFKAMDTYYAKDTSEYVFNFFRKEAVRIKVNKIVPMKIDIFKSGDQFNGTFSVVELQRNKALDVVDGKTEKRADLKNIHVVNDTLIAEIATLKKNLELRMAKSGNDTWLIIKATSEKDLLKEECNKLATIQGNYIIYKALNGSAEEVERIKQSTNCSVEKSIEESISKGYKKEKKEYLREILSMDI